MRKRLTRKNDAMRRVHPTLGASPALSLYGYFELGELRIISSGAGDKWEHVSVSCADRCPTWDEMCRVKAVFWGEDETVLQFHPRDAEYINHHPFCLHLWKEAGKNHRLPPSSLVG